MANGGTPHRGEIFYIDFNPARGSEQAGRRPGVVISLDSFNAKLPVVVVAAVTSKVRSSPICVHLPAGSPLPQASMIMPFQVVTVDQSRLESYCGALDAAQLLDLEHKMRLCWGL